jgi:hypothetical protein
MSSTRNYRVIKAASSATTTVPTNVQPMSIWAGSNGAIAVIGATTSAQYPLSAHQQVISSLTQTTNPFLQSIDGVTAVFADVGGHAARIRANVRNGLGAALQALVYIGARADVSALTFNGTGVGFADATPTDGSVTFGYIPSAAGLVDVTVTFAAAGNKGLFLDYNGVQYFNAAFAVA